MSITSNFGSCDSNLEKPSFLAPRNAEEWKSLFIEKKPSISEIEKLLVTDSDKSLLQQAVKEAVRHEFQERDTSDDVFLKNILYFSKIATPNAVLTQDQCAEITILRDHIQAGLISGKIEDKEAEYFIVDLAAKLSHIPVLHETILAATNARVGDVKSTDLSDTIALVYKRVISQETTIKLVGHAFELKGFSQIENQDVNLEGAQHETPLHAIIPSLSKFCTQFPELLNDVLAKELEDALALSDLGSSKELLERAKTGKLVIMNAGFTGHSVRVVIWRDTFLVVDRAGVLTSSGLSALLPKSLIVMKFDPNKLSERMITIIRGMRLIEQGKVGNALNKIMNKLKCQQTENELLIQKTVDIPLQLVGNCAWASVEGAIKAVFLLSDSTTLPPASSEEYSDLKSFLEEKFSTWKVFQQLELLDRYLAEIEQVDHNLIARTLISLWALKLKDPRLQKRINDIESRYFATVPEKHVELIVNKVAATIFPYPRGWLYFWNTFEQISQLLTIPFSRFTGPAY